MNAELLAHQNEQLLEEIEGLQEQLAISRDNERELAELAAEYKTQLNELLSLAFT